MPHTHWDEPTISWKPDLNNTKCGGTAPTISCKSPPFPFYWPASCTCARCSTWQTWRFFLTNRSELLLPLDTQLPLPVQDDKQTSLATYIYPYTCVPLVLCGILWVDTISCSWDFSRWFDQQSTFMLCHLLISSATLLCVPFFVSVHVDILRHFVEDFILPTFDAGTR